MKTTNQNTSKMNRSDTMNEATRKEWEENLAREGLVNLSRKEAKEYGLVIPDNADGIIVRIKDLEEL